MWDRNMLDFGPTQRIAIGTSSYFCPLSFCLPSLPTPNTLRYLSKLDTLAEVDAFIGAQGFVDAKHRWAEIALL
jgi:hypothetical protein